MRKIPDSYARIWESVSRIPRGRVSTYGTIARLAGFGNHARLVGYALHALPRGSDIPWHRVINSGGKISLRKAGGGEHRQERKLRQEGVPILKGRIDLAGCGWPQGIRERAGRRTTSRRG